MQNGRLIHGRRHSDPKELKITLRDRTVHFVNCMRKNSAKRTLPLYFFSLFFSTDRSEKNNMFKYLIWETRNVKIQNCVPITTGLRCIYVLVSSRCFS